MLAIEYVHPRSLEPRTRQLRKRHPKQLDFLKRGISTNGFLEPVLKKDGRVVHGELRVAAAIELGLNAIPAIELDHLSAEQVRAYVISANQIASLAGFDEEALIAELGELAEFDIDLCSLGFETGELDRLLGNIDFDSTDDEEDLPAVTAGPPVARLGDHFRLGQHNLICADALASASYEALLAGELAQLILSDPPYNDKVADISGSGRFKHREFVQASGEMSDLEFTRFLTTVMRLMRLHSVDGSLHYLFMCGRQLLALLRAGNVVYDELKAIVTWDKGSGGLGSLYRNQTEFVGVFKWGKQPHINNVMLGKFGRNRTTLWQVDNGPRFLARAPGIAGDSSHDQTVFAFGGCDSGRVDTGRAGARSVCRIGEPVSGGREDRTPRSGSRA